MGAHRGWFTEIWVKPLQYPISAAAFMAAFALGVVVVRPRGRQPGATRALPAERRTAPRYADTTQRDVC
jgi:hypothetical protein